MSPTWDAADLDAGTSDGVVHESTANTSYSDASEIRKGDPTANPIRSDILTAWYPMQEDSGASTLYDFAGTYDGTPDGATPDATGLAGTRAWSFDGTNDLINIGNPIVAPGSSLSASAWVYADSLTSENNYKRILSKYPADPGSIIFGISDNVMQMLVAGDETLGKTFGNTVLNTDEWYHLAWVYDSGTVDFYLNGSSDGSGSAPSSLSSYNQDWGIGEDITGDLEEHWDGRICDVRIYDGALSASDVQEIYDVFGAPSTHTAVKK